jgi:uncharacterized phage protein gp47/JayE
VAINFKTPEEIAAQYLTWLKGLKPEVNTSQTDSDWWIRAQVIGGVFSGVYADQRKIAEDAFPQNARHEALENFLQLYFNESFKAATQSQGNIKVTGVTGSIIPIGTEFTYTPNGNVYQATESITLSQASGVVAVQSINPGQDQNLLEGAALTISSPPAGIDSTALVYGGNLADGTNEESDDAAKTRILNRIRNPLSGGTKTDYEQWAVESDQSVNQASAIRYIFGPGTVGVVITAGTTDIDDAVTNGDPVVRIPSTGLIESVQEYIDARKPLTDCAHVIAPNLKSVNVIVNVRYETGDGTTIPNGQTLTQEELVVREVKRAIYKVPPGGRRIGSTGFVLASEIEEVIDAGLSTTPYTEGEFAQILRDRQVQDLSASGANLIIAETELAEPGVVTVVDLNA